MAKILRYIHVVDVEATCWDNGSNEKTPTETYQYGDDLRAIPCRPNEIIEIGIARIRLTNDHGKPLSPNDVHVDKVGQCYSQPKWHPQLSQFCKELTGIEQHTINSADNYLDAIAKLQEDFGKEALQRHPWASWGDYDRTMFEHMRDNVWAGTKPNPWGKQHINIKTLHALMSGLAKPVGVSGGLNSIGKKFEGRPHCGLDDAKNIAKILIHILKRTRNLDWRK